MDGRVVVLGLGLEDIALPIAPEQVAHAEVGCAGAGARMREAARGTRAVDAPRSLRALDMRSSSCFMADLSL